MKPTPAIAWLLALIIFTLTPTGFAQERRETTEEDPGVDVAVIIVTKANLREGPGTSSRVIKEVNRGEVLALVSRNPSDPGTTLSTLNPVLKAGSMGTQSESNTPKEGKPVQSFKKRKPALARNL